LSSFKAPGGLITPARKLSPRAAFFNLSPREKTKEKRRNKNSFLVTVFVFLETAPEVLFREALKEKVTAF
jgi:hypothetical protein